MAKLFAFYKWLMSFRKTTWQLEDYPVRYRDQATTDPDSPRWFAQIFNWWVVTGLGDTKEQAFADLREHFNSISAKKEKMPRPGTRVPIEFATRDELDKYWDIASRIISDVLGFDPQGIFVSDGSSLWDFCEEDSDADRYVEEIKLIFEVDVTHIENGNLAEISRYIWNETKV